MVRPPASFRLARLLVRHFSSTTGASISDSQTYQLPTGRLRVSLAAPSVIGRAQSRGERPYQEDAICVTGLRIRRREITKSWEDVPDVPECAWKGKRKADEEPEGGEQVLLASVMDGHGGKEASEYLRDNLAPLIEGCRADEVPAAVRAYRELGGYFRRFRGGYLERLASEVWTDRAVEPRGEGSRPEVVAQSAEEVGGSPPRFMELGERLTLAFLQADQRLISAHPASGSVCTAVLMAPLPLPPPAAPVLYPFFGAPLLNLTVAHVGDTRALLCSSGNGRVVSLTQPHHPESPAEAERLRRVGTGLVTDSFGESRWGGALANTRGLGDAKFKRLGVTGEPTIYKRVIKGADWSFVVLVSDGVSGAMSDQELVDLVRGHSDPTKAAQAVVDFAEQVGARDNLSVVIVPLAGWGLTGGQDWTASRREFRLRQNAGRSGRQRRM